MRGCGSGAESARRGVDGGSQRCCRAGGPKFSFMSRGSRSPVLPWVCPALVSLVVSWDGFLCGGWAQVLGARSARMRSHWMSWSKSPPSYSSAGISLGLKPISLGLESTSLGLESTSLGPKSLLCCSKRLWEGDCWFIGICWYIYSLRLSWRLCCHQRCQPAHRGPPVFPSS